MGKVMSNTPIYTNDEELEIFKKYSETKNIELRNEIIMHNIGLVKMLANKVAYFSNLDPEDLFQYGIFGLISAINNFDYKKGFKFSTYAYAKILRNIDKCVKKFETPLRLPVRHAENVEKIKKVIKEYEINYNRLPTTSEIEEKTKLSHDTVENIILNFERYQSFVYLDKIYGETSGNFDSSDSTYGEYCLRTTENIDDSYFEEELKAQINEMLDECLNDKEKTIINLRYGLNGHFPLAQGECAKLFNCTHQNISALEKKALIKLRDSEKVRSKLHVYY